MDVASTETTIWMDKVLNISQEPLIDAAKAPQADAQSQPDDGKTMQKQVRDANQKDGGAFRKNTKQKTNEYMTRLIATGGLRIK